MNRSYKPVLVFLVFIVSSSICLAFSRYYSTSLTLGVFLGGALFYLGKRWVRWPLFFCLLSSAITLAAGGTFSPISTSLSGLGLKILAAVHLYAAIAVGFFARVDDWFSERNATPRDTWNLLFHTILAKRPRARTVETPADPAGLLRKSWLVTGVSKLILIDLTGVRENVMWELDLCATMGFSDKVIFLAEERECAAAVQIAQQRGKQVHLYRRKLREPLALRREMAETLARKGHPEKYRAIIKRLWRDDYPLRGVIGFSLGSVFPVPALVFGYERLSPLVYLMGLLSGFFCHGAVGAALLCSGWDRGKSALIRILGFGLGFSVLAIVLIVAMGVTMVAPYRDLLLNLCFCFLALGFVGVISTPFLLRKRGAGSMYSSVRTGGLCFGIGGLVVAVVGKIVLSLSSPAVSAVLPLGVLPEEIPDQALFLPAFMFMVALPLAIVGGLLGARIRREQEDTPALIPEASKSVTDFAREARIDRGNGGPISV